MLSHLITSTLPKETQNKQGTQTTRTRRIPGAEPTYNDYWNWRSGIRKSAESEITQDEWINWWAATGKWNERSVRRGGYCMARIDTTKPFSLDNIELRHNHEKTYPSEHASRFNGFNGTR